MIAYLNGLVLEKQPPKLLLDVHGVGYEVFAPMSTFYRLPDIGEKLSLHIHFVVREDAQLLFGFYTKRERALFRALIKVNGVGPKLAIGILSSIDPDAFVRCVHASDVSTLVSIPGVGKKTAERLIVETKSMLATWTLDQDNKQLSDVQSSTSQTVNDAIEALVVLGYKQNDAKRAIDKIKSDGLTSEAMIKKALQEGVC